MKDSLVVWSGGADSTLVLRDLAQYSSAQHPVRAVSFEHNQITAAQEHQYARNRILKWLRDCGHHVRHAVVSIKVSGGFEFRTTGNPQAVIWTLAAQMLRDDEDLYFGYTKGESWWRGGNLARTFTEHQRLANRRGCLYMPLASMDRPAVLH